MAAASKYTKGTKLDHEVPCISFQWNEWLQHKMTLLFITQSY
jgi:hypothetical protein